MGTRAWMLRTFVGCCVWILHGLNAAVAVPVPTEGPFDTGIAFPSAVESQAPHVLVPGAAETSTAVPLPLTTMAEVPASLMDGLLGGGPTSPAFPTRAELSDVATAASEYSPRAATTASEYSPRLTAGSDAEASPLPSEPGETQVPAGDPQPLTNATRSVNVSQENDAPAADAASFSTRKPLYFSSAEPSIMGAATNTSIGTTLASPQFVDISNNVSVSVTRERAEGLEPVVGITSVPNFLSPSALGTQPTPRATGYPAANSPLGLGITALPSRALDTATMGVSKEGASLPVGFQSGAPALSLSPNAGELLATQQDEQASEATRVTQEPAGETAPAAEEHPAPLEPGNAGDTPGDAFGVPDLAHPSLGSETVSGAVGNPEETSRLAGKTEPSLETSLGPDRDEQGSPGVDLDSPYATTSPAASEVLAAPAEHDVKSVSSSPATAAFPERMAPLPAGTATTDEPSLLPVPWDAAAGGLPTPVDIPNESSSSSLASSSTADSPQPALDAVATTLPGADDGAEVLASPNLNTPVSPSLGEPELQGTAAGTSDGAGLPSEDGPGVSLNPALDAPSLASLGPASPVPGGWLGTGPEQPAAEGSEAGAAEQALGGGGSTAGDEPSLSSAPVSETAAVIDQDTSSPSAPVSSSDVAAASSVSETDAGTSSNPALDTSSSVSLVPEAPRLPGASLGLPAEEGSEAIAAEQMVGGGGSAAGAASSSSFIPGSGTALGTDQLPDTRSPAGPSSPIDVAVASAISETDAAGPIPEAAPGPDGLSQASLANEGGPDVAAAPGDSPQLAPGARTLPGADDGAETPETAASPNRGAESLSLGGSELQGTVSGFAGGAGLPLIDGPGTSSNPALDASSPGSSRPDGPEFPGASLGLPAEEGSEAVAAEQALGGGDSVAGPASSSSFIPGRGVALGTDQLPDTGSPAGPSSPIDVAAASITSETDAAGPIPEAASGPDGLSQASLASEGGPDVVAALEAETAGAVAETGTGNLVSTSPDTDMSPPAFRPQQDTATLREPSAGEDGALADSELSPPSLLRSGAGEPIALGEQSLSGPAAPGSAGLDSDLETDAGQGDLPSHLPSAPDSSQLAPGAAGSTLPGAGDGAETPETAASPSLGAEPLSLGESEPLGTVSGSAGGAGLPLVDGPGTSSNPALDASSSVSLAPEGPEFPGASLRPPAEAGSEAIAAEQALGGGGSAAGAELSLGSAAGSGTALGTDQLPDTRSPAGPSSPIDVAVASAISETDAAGPIPEAAPGPDGLSQASLANEGGPDVAAAPGDSPQLAPGARTLPGADDGAETPETAASPNRGAESLSLGGSELQGTVSGFAGGAGLPLIDGPGTSSNPALDASSSGSSRPDGPEFPDTSLGLPAEKGSEAVAAEQALGGGDSATGAELSLGSAAGSGTALGFAAGPSSPIDVAAASVVSETDAAGPIPEAAPGPGGLSQASLANEGGPDVAAAPGDSPQLAPGARTLPGADNGGETPETAASPNLGAESLSLGGSELQGTVSGSAGGAGLHSDDGPGTSSNPALDASSSGSSRPDGPEFPDTSLGLPAEKGSEAVAAEQALGGGDSATGAELSLGSPAGSGTALGFAGGPSSPIDVAAASVVSETDAAGPIPEAAPGPGGLSQASLANEGGPDLAPAPGDSPQLAPGASILPGADDGAEMPASPNLSSPVVPSLEVSEPQVTVGSTSDGAGLPGTSGPGLNPALQAQSPASFSQGEPVLPVPWGSPGAGPGLPAVEGSKAGTAEQIPGEGGSTAGAEQSLSSALGTSKVLPDAGSPSGPASASDVAAASTVWDTDNVNNLGGVLGAPGLSQPALRGAPASVGAQPELPSATGEADELAKAVPGEGASPGESQGSVAEGTSVLEGFDGAGRSVEHTAPSSLSVGGSSSLGTASVATEGAGLPDASGGAAVLNTAASGPGSSGAEGAPMSTPGIQSGSDLGDSEAKLSQADVVELPGRERGVPADKEASIGAILGAGAGGLVQAAPGVLAPLALASPPRLQTLLPPALDTGVATTGIARLLGSSLLLPAHGLEVLPASLEGTGGTSGLVPKEKSLSPSSIHSGSSLGVADAPLPAANVPHGPLAGAEMALPWSPGSELTSGMPAPSGEVPLAELASPNVGPAEPPAAESLSPGSRFSSPGSTSDLTVGPSTLEKGALGAASDGPYGSALLLPPSHPKNPGVPSAPAAAEGRGDADSPGRLSPGLPGAAAGPGAAAQLPPRTATGPPAQSSIAQSSTGGSSGLAPISVAAGTSLTKFPGAGSAGGSSPAVLQPSSSSKAIAGLSHAAAAGPAAAAPSLPGAVLGQGAARGGPPATTRLPVSCSPTAAAPASQASLRKVTPEPGANGAAALLPQGSSNAFPAPLGGSAAPLPMTAAVPLYAYGTRENDREYVERRVDFNSPLFKPETGFPFGKALRDSLYFTDNGQIIFPASDKNLFPFPSPPPGGFNGREKVPMIAVFWDDADFSRGVGTTFYQEFFTLNSAKPRFVYDVEAKIRRYMKTSYSAVWTLKITWEKAPAHTARTDTRRTSTYQAVLTTDGFRSYLLILYQDAGMRWDYSQLAATNVLIGYSSGDGSYHNDDLTQRPPAAKYRPDQFRGSNTDLRGLWIYKLESRVGTNYRLKCLAWTGRQQEPRVWSRDLPSCPCSLQQGQRDPRFRSARGGRLDGSRLTMLHSASPNQHGAGVRCLYDSRGQFAEGRQERYWRFSRQASPYRDQELKLHDWCCNQAGSAQLCARYSEKRPEIGCDGYQAPGTGRSSEEANSHSEEQEDGDAK